MARDKLNQEKHDQNDGFLARMADRAKKLPIVSQIRDYVGGKADAKATEEMFSMQRSGASQQPPDLAAAYVKGSGANKQVVQNNAPQLEPISFTFNYGNGAPPEILGGYHLKADPGKPTVVYFGGSDFNRGSKSYQDAIKNMAEEARKQGMGFVTLDYPGTPGEENIKRFVEQATAHLEQIGVPKNQQAYAGFSLGGFPAMYAAAQNPEAAGLQLTSTFSSARQASKDGMVDKLGAVASIVPKHNLSQVMDNVALADQIVAQQQARAESGQDVMPVKMISSPFEEFGEAGNKHMTPLAARFEAYPDAQANVQVQSTQIAIPGADKKDQHLLIQGHFEQKDAFKSFIQEVSNRSEAHALAQDQQQNVAPAQNEAPPPLAVQPEVEVVQIVEENAQPKVGQPTVKVKDMLGPKHQAAELQNELKVEMPEAPEEEVDPSKLSVQEKIQKFGGGKKVQDALPAKDLAPSQEGQSALRQSRH